MNAEESEMREKSGLTTLTANEENEGQKVSKRVTYTEKWEKEKASEGESRKKERKRKAQKSNSLNA